MSHPSGNERAPLLRTQQQDAIRAEVHRRAKVRAVVSAVLSAVFITTLVVMLVKGGNLGYPWGEKLPKGPRAAAEIILSEAPIIDTHIDLPDLVRGLYRNNASAVDLESRMPGHVDIPRLRKGRVGGVFWSVYAACPTDEEAGPDFLNASWRVRDTLEQIDVMKLLINKYPNTFQYALTSADIRAATRAGKIASLLGIEGGHQLGNSLGALRQMYALGVRYVTITHFCHNAFADSCGYLTPLRPLHGGLSQLGETLVLEMNRLGMLVDISHTSDSTAAQVLRLSKAPVIWSHSSARAIADVPRNVPDSVLRMVGTGPNKTDGVIMVNFAPEFISVPPEDATLEKVADHVEHIAAVAGKKHVGIGSDYDGIPSTPVGLEDVSTYPALVAELYKRGWTRKELMGFTGGNLLRVFAGAEKVARDLQRQRTHPAMDVYEKREDL